METDMYTLTGVAADPASVATELVLPSGATLVLRPLELSDRDALTSFFDGLSAQTRSNGGVSGDTPVRAAEHCDAIGRYDKLRLVLCDGGSGGHIVGLIEVSFDLVTADVERFRGYGVDLGPPDARFGLCVADAFGGTGAAVLASRATFDIVKEFGRARLILWGGVLEDNIRARRFYRRLGFTEFETWLEPDGEVVRDGLLEL
jgi:RimJ/RimL family protein N-acetyltransferase